jgi:hypothetical protein
MLHPLPSSSEVANYANDRRNKKLRDSQATVAGITTTRPNFLIIGAAKSGTTALWHYLRQHPQIYMSPRKHTRFFAFEVEKPGFRRPVPKNPSVPCAFVNIDAYYTLYRGATNEMAISEASHSYLNRPKAPERVREHASGAAPTRGANLARSYASATALEPEPRQTPTLARTCARVINAYFREDSSKLQNLIQRDLSAWLERNKEDRKK